MLAHLDEAVALLRESNNNPNLAVGTALFDAGYYNNHNLQTPGPNRLIALGKRARTAGERPPSTPPAADAPARDHMAWRLSTPEGRALYKKRGATVEPLNGHHSKTAAAYADSADAATPQPRPNSPWPASPPTCSDSSPRTPPPWRTEPGQDEPTGKTRRS